MHNPDTRDRYPHLIDGAWTDPDADTYTETTDPATGDPIASVAAGTAADVDTAVAAARNAFPAWRDTDPVTRGQRVHRVAELIRANKERLATIESLDQGKPVSQAVSDMEGAARYFEYYAGAADKLEGASIPVGPDQVDYTVREPYGVSAQIVPWNFPGNLFARGVAPALVSGNTAVVKPAPTTPLSAFHLAELCHEAGIPAGAVNVVAGDGTPGEALTAHDGVDTITFTGSLRTGREVMRAAADTVTPVTLELGGKNPAVVYPDADLAEAVGWVATAIFTNAGQVCSAADRALVHEDVVDEFVDRITAAADGYDLGPGVGDPDMGPLNSREHYERVRSYVERAREAGATVAAGGLGADVPDGGRFIRPTVLVDVDPGMEIAQAEVFGPVLVVLTFGDDDDPIAVANDVQYGLTAGVFTNDIRRAHRDAARLEAGNVYVNKWFGDTNQTPFGGYKASGIGREKGLDALDSYLQTKNVAINLDRGVGDDLPGA
jgi:aldehyde dehydrogenase (NAD+)